MVAKERRRFLGMTAAAAGSSMFPAVIRDALAIEANSITGTIADIEHVVILMQENRSFDHYFGTLAGVRGFNDPRAITLPSGLPVWYQPDASGKSVLPYHFDVKNTSALSVGTNHGWKTSQQTWQGWDAWVKQKTTLSMGYFNRQDLPFYYALADAFTLCDEYHCSIFGATDPNRLFMLSGTNCGRIANMGALYNISPSGYYNNDPAKDDISAATTATAPTWRTYAEVLESNQVSWKVYQEWDNYGDNYLAYFRNFRVNADGSRLSASSPLYQRGRALAAGSTEANSAGTKGDWLVASFADDVRNDRLPAVSWICAPNDYCEHSPNSPNAGENLTARLLAALVANPAVWSKTVFLLTYDENDGFFDHMPAHIPPLTTAMGRTTLADIGQFENYGGVPVGLGPRVPMLVVSPWSKGGRVCSQLFDHTSQLRFLEEWLVARGKLRPNVQCDLISPWRRTVCGDMTSAFDFQSPNANWPASVPKTTTYALVNGKPSPVPPAVQNLSKQEPCSDISKTRPACRLPYNFNATGIVNSSGQVFLSFLNPGAAGAAFIVYSSARSDGPWYYAVEAGKSIANEVWNWSGIASYQLSVHGPNGFMRQFKGSVTSAARPEAQVSYDLANQQIILLLSNPGTAGACTFTIADNAYGASTYNYIVQAGTAIQVSLPVGGSFGWYDVSIRCSSDAQFLRRVAGHLEGLAVARTDPALSAGPAAPAASLTVLSNSVVRGASIGFSFIAPQGKVDSRNWIGIYGQGTSPGKGSSLKWTYVPQASGTWAADTSTLAIGNYTAWYLYRDGYEVLGGPVSFSVR